jgi:hypothetical protein
MASKIKRILFGEIFTKVIVSLITGGILAALTWFFHLWAPIGSFFLNSVETVWLWLSTPHAVAGWIFAGILLLASFGLFVAFAFIAIWARGNAWQSYCEERINGVVWRWQYRKGEINGLRPYCPMDDTLLLCTVTRPSPYNDLPPKTDFDCDNCGRVHSEQRIYEEIQDKVERHIDRNIRTGRWRKDLGEIARRSEG